MTSLENARTLIVQRELLRFLVYSDAHREPKEDATGEWFPPDGETLAAEISKLLDGSEESKSHLEFLNLCDRQVQAYKDNDADALRRYSLQILEYFLNLLGAPRAEGDPEPLPARPSACPHCGHEIES